MDAKYGVLDAILATETDEEEAVQRAQRAQHDGSTRPGPATRANDGAANRSRPGAALIEHVQKLRHCCPSMLL